MKVVDYPVKAVSTYTAKSTPTKKPTIGNIKIHNYSQRIVGFPISELISETQRISLLIAKEECHA